jgi:hypothetical protein
VPPSEVFGPLDLPRALGSLSRGFLQATLVAVLLWATIGHRRGQGLPWARFAALTLTAGELALANGWLMATISPTVLDESPSVRHVIGGDPAAGEPLRIVRASRRQWTPRVWRTNSSQERLREIVRWESGTLAPRYHLRHELSMVDSFSTFVSHDFGTLLRVARQGTEFAGRMQDGLPDWLLDALSVRYLVGPGMLPWYARRPPSAEVLLEGEKVPLWENPNAFPTCWIVHEVERLPRLTTKDPAAVTRRTQQIFFRPGTPLNLRRTAVIETDDQPELPTRAAGSDTVRIVAWSPSRIELEVQLSAAGLLVRNDLFDPGWRAERCGEHQPRSTPLPILRTNRIMQGVLLPAGRQRIVFRYAPSSLCYGAALSCLAWTALLLGLPLARRWSN